MERTSNSRLLQDLRDYLKERERNGDVSGYTDAPSNPEGRPGSEGACDEPTAAPSAAAGPPSPTGAGTVYKSRRHLLDEARKSMRYHLQRQLLEAMRHFHEPPTEQQRRRLI